VPALDDAPEVVEVLSDRATELARDPRAQAVVLVGHGPTLDEDVAAWERLGIRLAGGVRDRGHFAAARALVVRDDAPAEVRAAAVHAARERVARYLADTGQPVIVVPWVVGAGQLTRTRLAEDFADLGVRYDGRPLLPHSALENWITRELALASMALPRAQPGAVVSLWER